MGVPTSEAHVMREFTEYLKSVVIMYNPPAKHRNLSEQVRMFNARRLQQEKARKQKMREVLYK